MNWIELREGLNEFEKFESLRIRNNKIESTDARCETLWSIVKHDVANSEFTTCKCNVSRFSPYTEYFTHLYTLHFARTFAHVIRIFWCVGNCKLCILLVTIAWQIELHRCASGVGKYILCVFTSICIYTYLFIDIFVYLLIFINVYDLYMICICMIFLFEFFCEEKNRQMRCIELIASENFTSRGVMESVQRFDRKRTLREKEKQKHF